MGGGRDRARVDLVDAMSPLAILLAGGALLFAVVSRPKIKPEPEPGDNLTRQQRLRSILAGVQELDDTQRAFLLITARGESNFNPLAHNGTDSEVAACARAVANDKTGIVARTLACGVPTADLITGSWGLFQRLAPYLANDAFEVFGDDGCTLANPTRTSVAFQIASALETAGDLQRYNGWRANPTLGNLRLGWAAPGLMGYMQRNEKRIARYRRHARDIGYPASIIDAALAPFPRGRAVAEIYARLVAGGA